MSSKGPDSARCGWDARKEGEQAWKVPASELLQANCNLDRKNPRAADDIPHRAPDELLASILEKESEISQVLGRIQGLLRQGT